MEIISAWQVWPLISYCADRRLNSSVCGCGFIKRINCSMIGSYCEGLSSSSRVFHCPLPPCLLACEALGKRYGRLAWGKPFQCFPCEDFGLGNWPFGCTALRKYTMTLDCLLWSSPGFGVTSGQASRPRRRLGVKVPVGRPRSREPHCALEVHSCLKRA